MARQLITSYSFNPTAGTVTLTGLTNIDPAQVVSIYDYTLRNSPYIPESTAKGVPMFFAANAITASVSGGSSNVLTIPKENIPPQAKSTDTLTIYYGYNSTPTIVRVQ